MPWVVLSLFFSFSLPLFSLSLFLILFLSPLPNLSFYSSKQISKAVFAQLTASTPPQPPSPPSPAAAEGDEEAPHAPPLSSSTLPRAAFAALVAAASDALSKPEKRPFAALSRSSFETACGLVERRTPIALLLAGTSGSGKTTLAGLLAARLGGASVVSTDSVRHALASSLPPNSREAMLLRASTYEAGDLLVEWEREGESGGGESGGAGAAARRGGGGGAASAPVAAAAATPPPSSYSYSSSLSPRDRAAVIRGYEAQAALVQPAVERIVAAAAARGESVVVEGAHVGIPFAVALCSGSNPSPNPSTPDGSPRLHPCACPFLVHISNEQKHAERFAVRAKAMVAINDAAGSGRGGGKRGGKSAGATSRGSRGRGGSTNSYVAALPRIRAIQARLRSLALSFAVPCVDNTSVDRSVEAVARAVLGCARRVAAGGRLVSREEAPPPPPPPPPSSGSDGASSSSSSSSSSSAVAAAAAAATAAATVLTCRPVAAEFAAATAALWSSKAALGLIRQKREQRGESVGFLPRGLQQQQRQQEQQRQPRRGRSPRGGQRRDAGAPSSSSAPSTSAASSPPRALSELDTFAAAELMISRGRSGSSSRSGRRNGAGSGSRSGRNGRHGGGCGSRSDGGEHSPSAPDSSGSEGEGGGARGSFSSRSPSPSRAAAPGAAAAAGEQQQQRRRRRRPPEGQGAEGADSLGAAPKVRSSPPALPLPLPPPAARALLAAAAAADDGGVSVTEGEDEDEDDEEDEDGEERS